MFDVVNPDQVINKVREKDRKIERKREKERENERKRDREGERNYKFYNPYVIFKGLI